MSRGRKSKEGFKVPRTSLCLRLSKVEAGVRLVIMQNPLPPTPPKRTTSLDFHREECGILIGNMTIEEHDSVRSWSLISKLILGPESAKTGIEDETRFLDLLMTKRAEQIGYSKLRPWFHFEKWGGEEWGGPGPDFIEGINRLKRFKDGYFCVIIGLGKELVMMSGAERAPLLSSLVREGALMLCQYAKKKDREFPELEFIAMVEDSLEEYRLSVGG